MSSFGKILVISALVVPAGVFAATTTTTVAPAPMAASAAGQYVLSAFKNYVSVSPSISIPTVLSVPVTLDPSVIPVIAVYNLTTGVFEPSLLKESVTRLETPVQVTSNGVGRVDALNDGSYATFLEFPLREGANRAEITFSYSKPITASSLSFALDQYVAIPPSITIRAMNNNIVSIVLAPARISATTVTFPQVTSAVWQVSFDYVQPLRITEMKFNENAPGTIVTRDARFLAQPGQSYQLYFNADRYVNPPTKEAGDLSSNKGVVAVSSAASFSNPAYVPADSDKDSVPDLRDNCVNTSNPDQMDSDGNGRGDACEDYDRDGVVNALDNCQNTPNQDQLDTDADGIGDACDTVDNRVTEQLPWLPWAGIGVAAVVLLTLFILAFKYKRDDVPAPPEAPNSTVS